MGIFSTTNDLTIRNNILPINCDNVKNTIITNSELVGKVNHIGLVSDSNIRNNFLRKVDVHTQTDNANVEDDKMTKNESTNKVNLSELLAEKKFLKDKVSCLKKNSKIQEK